MWWGHCPACVWIAWRRLAFALALAAPSFTRAYDDACWADGNGFSFEACCNPFARRGNPQCWSPPVFTFDRCCTPASISTAVGPLSHLRVAEHPLAAEAANTLNNTPVLISTLPMPPARSLERSIVWQQHWACPPPIQERGRDGEAVEPEGLGGCRHSAFDEGLWASIHEVTHGALSFAQSAPGDEDLARPFASAIRLTHAFQQLWCTLRWWGCFPFPEGSRARMLAELCALIDLVLLDLSIALGLEATVLPRFWSRSASGDTRAGFSGTQEEAPPSISAGLCGRWEQAGESLSVLVVDALGPIFIHLERLLEEKWSTKRWPELGGLKKHYGQTLHGEPLVPYQGGPGGIFHHFAAAPEFSPACRALEDRPSGAPYFSGEGHAVWVDSTGTLSWHLSVLDLAEGLLGFREDWVIVNLGAEDGGCHSSGLKFWMYDPANCLLDANPHAGGVMLEGNAAALASLRKHHAGKAHVLCAGGYITPHGALDAILAATPCDETITDGPQAAAVKSRISDGDVDMLKVDVDFGDCDFLEALVGPLRPKFVHAEMNPHYPPPFAHRQHFDAAVVDGFADSAAHPSDHPSLGGPAHWIRGCSLSGIAQALGGRSMYVPVQVEFDHALFVRSDLAPRLVPLWPRMAPLKLWDHWLAGYHCHPLRLIAREDERAAGYDFRRFVPIGAQRSEADVEAAMRIFLRASGGRELPMSARRATLFSEGGHPMVDPVSDMAIRSVEAIRGDAHLGRFPFSLERCITCG